MAINVGSLVSVKSSGREQLGIYAKHIPFEFGDYCIVYLGSNTGENLASEKVVKPTVKVFEANQVKTSSEKGDKADNLLKGFKVLKEKGFKFESELNKLDQLKIKFESSKPSTYEFIDAEVDNYPSNKDSFIESSLNGKMKSKLTSDEIKSIKSLLKSSKVTTFEAALVGYDHEFNDKVDKKVKWTEVSRDTGNATVNRIISKGKLDGITLVKITSMIDHTVFYILDIEYKKLKSKNESELSKLDEMNNKFESIHQHKKSVKDIMDSFIKNPYGINAGSVAYANENKTYFEVFCESKTRQSKSIEKLIELGVPKNSINIQKVLDSAYTNRFRYTVNI